jgi:HlyD family secretion protein
VQNVVTYDVVLGVSNPELLLKPGMTANARIITAEQKNVLQVPLQALRFSPKGGDKGDQAEHRHADHTASLWVLHGSAPREIQVVRGIDDGTSVEILGGDLKPGDQVVIDENAEGAGGRKPRLAKPQMGGMRHF